MEGTALMRPVHHMLISLMDNTNKKIQKYKNTKIQKHKYKNTKLEKQRM